MTLIKIEEDIKAAMKNKNELVRDTLRMLKASIVNKGIEKRKALMEDDIIGIIRTEIKKRKETLELVAKGGRTDPDTVAEIAVLNQYLPTGPNEEQIRAVVQQIIAVKQLSGVVNMGPVMKEAKAQLGSSVDGAVLSKIVKELLAQ